MRMIGYQMNWMLDHLHISSYRRETGRRSKAVVAQVFKIIFLSAFSSLVTRQDSCTAFNLFYRSFDMIE